MVKNTFKKAERLSSKKIIQELFQKGSSFYLYPLKVLYLKIEDKRIPHDQVLFTVSKRKFRKAVERNKLKRRLREAYRQNKCTRKSQQKYYIAYIYVGKEILSFKEIEAKLKTSLLRFDIKS